MSSDISHAERMQGNNSGFDLESPNPFAYGTFGSPSIISSIPSGGGETMLPTNPFNTTNNSNNVNTSVIVSPSYSQSRSYVIGKGGAKTFSMISQPELSEPRFLSISKYAIVYLTFICCLIFGNMTQMIVLYNTLSDNNNKKYILIYVIFPFLCFIFLKVNDLNLCNQITYLLNFGYVSTPLIINKNRQIIHFLTFIGFPFLWIIHALLMCDWIQSIQITSNQTFGGFVKDETINSLLITLWTIIQFIEFILCIICLLYCIQHNIHRQEPKERETRTKIKNKNFNNKFSFSMTNPFNNILYKNNNNRINAYISKIQILERQISILQTDLFKSKQDNITTNSQLSTEYAEDLQEKNQEFRTLLSEKNLLKTELENKKSMLTMKKQQIKQQQVSIKSLQQIREENIQSINELKKKLNNSRKEMQKISILLQIERQNVQKAQQYFENFT